jgi:hypothetical protein
MFVCIYAYVCFECTYSFNLVYAWKVYSRLIVLCCMRVFMDECLCLYVF